MRDDKKYKQKIEDTLQQINVLQNLRSRNSGKWPTRRPKKKSGRSIPKKKRDKRPAKRPSKTSTATSTRNRTSG